MKNKMSKVLKNEKGLTLIELLAVIVILAIVSAIAIPAIGNIIDNTRYNAVKADGINVLNAANLYFTDNQSDTMVSVGELVGAGYMESPGKIPGTSTSTPITAEVASATDSTVAKVSNKLQLTTYVIPYTGSTTQTIKFTSATVDGINKASSKKGSDAGAKVITATGTTE